MRLTVYADFSLRLLMYLAVQDDGLTTIPKVARSYGISRNHLVKVAHRLGLDGYIITTRGMNGGLRLARSPEEINVGEVVRRMEPDMALVPCMHPVDSACPIVPACLLRNAIEEARSAFLKVLDGYTLADLAMPRADLQKLLGIPQIAPAKASAESSQIYPRKLLS
jgi:Rrf2 family nitric oxide-sensitive transcriptional repressor